MTTTSGALFPKQTRFFGGCQAPDSTRHHVWQKGTNRAAIDPGVTVPPAAAHYIATGILTPWAKLPHYAHHTPLSVQTFRPKKNFKEGTLRFELHKRATVRAVCLAAWVKLGSHLRQQPRRLYRRLILTVELRAATRHDAPQMKASLNAGVNLRECVTLPQGEDLNEWLAMHGVSRLPSLLVHSKIPLPKSAKRLRGDLEWVPHAVGVGEM